MSAIITGRPHLPFVTRTDLSGTELVDAASNYITSARAMIEIDFDEKTSDQTYGIFHVMCLAEATIEGAQRKLDEEYAAGKGDRATAAIEHLSTLVTLVNEKASLAEVARYITTCRNFLARTGAAE